MADPVSASPPLASPASSWPRHLVAASTNPDAPTHPLLDALVPPARRHRAAWKLATFGDTLRHGWRRWSHPMRDIEQRAQLDFTRYRFAFSRSYDDRDGARPAPLRRRDLLLWAVAHLVRDRRLPPAPDLVIGGGRFSFEWFPLRPLANRLALAVQHRPPVCTDEDLTHLRGLPSWAAARRWAATRWPTPAVARAALVWAARPDQPVWAWRQLFHRQALTRSLPVLPYPNTVEGREDFQPFRPGEGLGDDERVWLAWQGQQPVLADLPSLRGIRVPLASLITWMQQGLETQAPRLRGVRLHRWVQHDAPGGDPTQRAGAVAWYQAGDTFATAPLDAPAVDALCRWVQLDVADLITLAHHNGPPRLHARDFHHVSAGLLLGQVARRSLYMILSAVRHASGPQRLDPVQQQDLQQLVTPEAAAVPIRQWAWWAEDEPTVGRIPLLARVAGWTTRLAGPSPATAWAKVAEASPLFALQLFQQRAVVAPHWRAPSPRLLRPFLLSKEASLRTLAVGALGTLGTPSAPAETASGATLRDHAPLQALPRLEAAAVDDGLVDEGGPRGAGPDGGVPGLSPSRRRGRSV